ncbi:MAG: ABC transporter permease [Clostridia bacterium]|nr:ABC transporter permease [Clostridia bacterium]
MISQILREGFKNKTFLAGTIIILTMTIIAALAGVITNYSYDEINISNALVKPNLQHLFGTDQLGRDLFTRVVYGARIALRVGFIAVVIETFIGVTLGLLAGYYGGRIEKVILFITDLTWSMPPIILALAIVTMLGPSINNVIIAIAIVSWAQFTRVVRAKTQSIKNLPYIEAARAFGENDFDIILRYILPNIVPSIIVISTLALPSAIMATTALGFLGLGAQPPTPDWGVILSEGITYINKASWISIFPGIAIVSIVVGFNLLGEGLRDVLDPRLKV